MFFSRFVQICIFCTFRSLTCKICKFTKFGTIGKFVTFFTFSQMFEKHEKQGGCRPQTRGYPTPDQPCHLYYCLGTPGGLWEACFFVFFAFFWPPPATPQNSDPWSVCGVVFAFVCKLAKNTKNTLNNKFTDFSIFSYFLENFIFFEKK